MAVGVRMWAAGGVADGEAAPLLVVHDGPAYDREAGLTAFLADGVAAGRFPPLRAALLDAGPRDDRYSANERYAAELRTEVLPALAAQAPATVRVAMGTSLGALAALHAHRRAPGTFGALFLQSGSFFRPELDPQESAFPYWDRVVAFTGELLAAGAVAGQVPVAMTCGAQEENVHNNRVAAAALARQGHPVVFREVDGGHDFGAWRAAFEPALTDLLAGLVSDAR